MEKPVASNVRFVALAAVVSFLTIVFPAKALDSNDLSDILGFTMMAHTNVRGDFEGADYDKPVALDNGWIFEFTEYNYNYSYRPSVAVFAKRVSFKPPSGVERQLTIYKLVIDDTIYDARRIR